MKEFYSFINNSLGATSYEWTLDNSTISNEFLTYIFTESGEYQVSLSQASQQQGQEQPSEEKDEKVVDAEVVDEEKKE